MSSEWVLQKLSTLGTFDRGKSKHRPRDAAHLYGGPYPFIQTGDVTASGGRITTYRQTYSEAGLAQSKLWPVNTLCITIAANIAETGLLTYPACFPDSVVGFTADPKKADIRFIEYIFQAYRASVKSKAYGSVQENINLEVLRNLEFPIPSLNDQKKIADFFTLIDDRIALLRETNATLESITQALFKSWFVDFDPVHANAGTQAPSLPVEIQALFPSRVVESPQGLMPEGWEWGQLKDIASVVMGLSPKGESYNSDGSGVPLINGPVEFGEYFPVKTKWTDSASRMSIKGDMIFCVRGSTTGRRVISDGDYCIGRGVCAIRANKGFNSFIYQTINFGLARLLGKTTGSVFPSLSAPDIKEFTVLNPPQIVLAEYQKLTGSLVSRVQANHHHIELLTSLRDTLLPRLISGHLRLPEAEAALAEV